MNRRTTGFIGGGRVAKIILNGWKGARTLPDTIIITDRNIDTLEKLKNDVPQIKIVLNDVNVPATCDIVFIGLHPPVIGEVLQQIKSVLRPDAIVVSLAPKVSIAKISELLGGFKNIVRVNPNAPSIVNSGYNPVAFSPAMGHSERETIIEIMKPLGDCPEVSEELMESFAIITAMGPTYLWFQLYELQELAKSFGISSETIKDAIPKMLSGAAKIMVESGLAPAEVMDLVPVKPLGEDEETIRNIYQSRLNAMYKKLKS